MQPVCENKENETRGCLSVNDKVYPVYDGHNTIGRNLDATINLKRLNVSKNHAVITVFDHNSHYLSDFKSCNGTFLDGKKLAPLRLYQLENGASIKFGDVFCTYKKLEGGTAIGKSLDETQECSESFYGTGTQHVAVQDHEYGVNYNELPTQVFTSKELSFNEMATQVHDLLPQEDSSNDSIDFMTMQKASETQRISSDSQNGGGSRKEAQNGANQDCLSQINPVPLKSRRILDSDDESTPGKKVQGSDTEEYEIPEVTKSKYDISDDSETDIDDDEEEDPCSQNESSMKSLRLTESLKVSGGPQSLSDQKIEENESAEINEQPTQKMELAVTENEESAVPRTEEIFTLTVENKETPTEDPELEKSVTSETDQNKNEDIDDLFLQPTQSLDFFENKDKSCEEIFLQATQVLSIEKKEESAQGLGLQNEAETLAEEFSDEATQQLEENACQDLIGDEAAEIQQDVPSEEEKKSEDTPDHSIQDVSVQESSKKNTQENERNTSDLCSFIPDEAAKKTEEDLEKMFSEDRNDKSENDKNTPDIVDQIPLAESTKKTEEIEDQRPPEEELERLFSEDSDKLENHDDQIALAESTKKTQEIEDKLQTDEELEDTPNLDPFLSEPQKTNTTLSDDDDDFFAPTQQAEPSTSKNLFFKPFKVPSPVAQKKKLVEDDDSFILQPTQALEVLHDDGTNFAKVEDELHEIFASQSLLCTQQLVDVLDTTVGEIVDDSIQEVSIVGRKSEVLTTDSVKKILEESGEEETPKKSSREEQDDTPKGVEKNRGRKINHRLVVLEEEQNKGEEEKKNVTESSNSKAEGANKKGGKKDEGKSESEDSQSSKSSEKPGRRAKGKKEEESHTNTENEADKKAAGISRVPRKRKGKIEDDLQRSGDDEPESKRRSRKKGPEKSKDSESQEGNGGQKSDKEGPLRTGRRGRSKVEDDDKSQENSEKSEKSDSQSSRSSVRIGQRGRAKTIDESHDEPVSKKKVDKHKNEESGDEQSVKGDSQNSRVSKRIEQRERGKSVEGSASKKKSEEEKVESTGQPEKDNSNVSKRVGRGGRGKTVDEPQISGESSNKRGSKKKVDENSEEQREKDDSQSSTVPERVGRRGRSKTVELQSSVNEDKTKGTKKKGSQEQKSDKPEPQNSERNLRGKKTESETLNKNVTKEETKKTKKTNQTGEEEKTNTQAADPPPSRRTSKRKQEENEEPTPSKQAAKVSSPMKRPLRLPSNNSEDDFISKVPKVDTSPTKLRKSLRKTRNDDVVSVASDTSDSSSTPKKRRLSAHSRQQKREEGNSPVLPTPERSRRQLKPKVVFTMMNNPEMESVVRQLGGIVVDSVESCTVLVTEQVKRTQKLLCAVAQGKPICSPKWLLACKKSFSFLDPWDFLLVDKEAEKKWKFSLKTSLERGSRSKLLENHTFQIFVDMGADVIKGAIEACGGKCVTRNLPKCETEHLLIVSSEKNKNKHDKIAKQNKKIKVVEAEAIFDGTLRQEFKFDQFLLS